MFKKYSGIFNQTFHNEINRFGWVVEIDNLVVKTPDSWRNRLRCDPGQSVEKIASTLSRCVA